MQGTVKRKMETYGFLIPDGGGGDIFFHMSECVGGQEGFNALQEGQAVEFDVADSDRGEKAINVRVVK